MNQFYDISSDIAWRACQCIACAYQAPREPRLRTPCASRCDDHTLFVNGKIFEITVDFSRVYACVSSILS